MWLNQSITDLEKWISLLWTDSSILLVKPAVVAFAEPTIDEYFPFRLFTTYTLGWKVTLLLQACMSQPALYNVSIALGSVGKSIPTIIWIWFVSSAFAFESNCLAICFCNRATAIHISFASAKNTLGLIVSIHFAVIMIYLLQ